MDKDRGPSFGRIFATVWKTFWAILLMVVLVLFAIYALLSFTGG